MIESKLIRNGLFALSLVCGLWGYAQEKTTVSGTIQDESTGEGLSGANVIIKGKTVGTVTDMDGKFSFETDQTPPFTLQISMVGYATMTFEVTASNSSGISLSLKESLLMGQEVVVSASRVEESILESPVTIEKMDILAIKQSASASFYDGISNLKGVHTNTSSLTFQSFNTRGFATIANTRFVQIIDGMDNSAPGLNFPAGNVVGISEIDVESIELVPGAASALYGPNAFNGILFMNSKNPYDYQGLTAQAKLGVTNASAPGANPFYEFNLRYARAFLDDKLAFKINFSYLDAEDWHANDYETDIDRTGAEYGNNNFERSPSFDGMNTYGETQFTLPLSVINPGFADFGVIRAARTGYEEEDLVKNYNASSLKTDAALHYRFNDHIEALYNFRYGSGNTVYQGSQKYSLLNLTLQQHKLELKGKNFFVRGYATYENAGDSYNVGALGSYINEAGTPTQLWAPMYGLAYGSIRAGIPLIQLSALNPQLQDVVVADIDANIAGVPQGEEMAHTIARIVADGGRLEPGTPEFEAAKADIIAKRFMKGGASFVDKTRMFHGEFNYNFNELIKVFDFQVGANVRRYVLESEGTIFKDTDTDGNSTPISIDEFGAYGQISKKLIDDKLKLTASLRYDKNENFEGQLNPRFSAVFTAAKTHNFRASYQTGFRNPSTQGQFIFFNTGASILLGGTEANAGPFGIYNGGAYTRDSWNAYQASGDEAVLVVADFPYVKPEQIQAIEFGYKSTIANKFFIDLNYYFNSYKDFITQLEVVSAEEVTVEGDVYPQGQSYRPYANANSTVTSSGLGLGLSYAFPKGYVLGGNYSWNTFNLDESADEIGFEAQFNTPEHRFGASLANRDVINNFGFNIAYRWSDEYLWESDFGVGMVDAYSVLDLQISYKIESINGLIKLGGANVLGNEYRTSLGAPFVGAQYYISFQVDELFN